MSEDTSTLRICWYTPQATGAFLPFFSNPYKLTPLRRFGLLTPSTVPSTLQTLLSTYTKSNDGLKPLGPEDPIPRGLEKFWRGRMGLGKDEMREMGERALSELRVG